MFGALMLDGIGGHVDGADVVAVNQGSPANRRVQLNQKLAQPRNFYNSIGDSSVLGLSTRTRNCSLALGGLGDEIVPEEHSVARGGLARIRTTSPISISVDHKISVARGVECPEHSEECASEPPDEVNPCRT